MIWPLVKPGAGKGKNMSSTNEKTSESVKDVKRDGDDKAKAKLGHKRLRNTEQEKKLVEELERFYGTEYANSEREKFISDCVRKSHDNAQRSQQDDPVEAARFDDKIGELRKLWTDGDKPKEHPEIYEALKNAGITGVSIKVFEDDTWYMTNGAHEDSGSMTVGTNGIVLAAKRLTGQPE